MSYKDDHSEICVRLEEMEESLDNILVACEDNNWDWYVFDDLRAELKRLRDEMGWVR